jgi:hypothetical protein
MINANKIEFFFIFDSPHLQNKVRAKKRLRDTQHENDAIHTKADTQKYHNYR